MFVCVTVRVRVCVCVCVCVCECVCVQDWESEDCGIGPRAVFPVLPLRREGVANAGSRATALPLLPRHRAHVLRHTVTAWADVSNVVDWRCLKTVGTLSCKTV